MSEEWNVRRLEDLVLIKGGKRLPRGELLTNSRNSHPYVRVTDMNGRHISKENLQYVPEDIFPLIKRYIVNKGEVILSIVGTIGLVSIIQKELDNASLTENCVKLRPLDSNLSGRFLYYFLISQKGQAEIKKGTVGSTQPKLPLYNIQKIQIPLPPLNIQSRVANILSSLDDKIELNLQMNKTLAAMAQTIFREWFIDFRFPGFDGKLIDGLPPEWRNGYLIDIMDLLYGKALKSDERKRGNYPVVGSGGIVGTHGSFFVSGPGIVIGRKGTIGNVYWIERNFYPIDTTFFIKDLLGASSLYYHYFILRNQFFRRISSDSAVPGLNRNEALRNKVVVPTVQIVNLFNETIKPVFDKIRVNSDNITTLTILRDSLLPKLMAGKISLL